jgi:DNA-binding CsgD family transcriptional regulator
MDGEERPQLNAEDYRRVLMVLEACEAAGSLHEFLQVAPGAVSEQFGFPGASFVLATAIDGGAPRAHRIECYGQPFAMDEYFERWLHLDAFNSDEATADLRAGGTAQIATLAPRMRGARRRYIEDFLIPRRVQNQATVWLPTGRGSDGFLTLINDPDDPYDQRDRMLLLALRPHLTHLLRGHMPGSAEPPPGLSPREIEVVDLVALGYPNRAIADSLGIAENTVKKHVSRTLAKTGCASRTQLATRLRSQ